MPERNLNENCVYLTTYSGNKMPMFYIGSSSIHRIRNGYRGSVKSKKYSHIWKEELKNNPQLFKTVIISTHSTDKEAREKEFKLQKHLNVVKSELYINLSLAAKNGYFGRDVLGENHPNYGRKWGDDFKQKISKAKKGKKNNRTWKMTEKMKKHLSEVKTGTKHSEETKRKMSESHKGRPGRKLSEGEKERKRLQMTGTKRSPESIQKQIETRIHNKKTLSQQSRLILSNKNKLNARKQIKFRLIGPENNIVECYNVIHASEITKLHRSSINRLINNVIKIHKGWKLVE